MSDEAIRRRVMSSASPVPELRLADLSDMRKVMEAAGWTYTGDTIGGSPLFTKDTGAQAVPVSTPKFVSVSTCTVCGHRIHKPSSGLSWTTFASDGYSTYCEESLDQLHHVVPEVPDVD